MSNNVNNVRRDFPALERKHEGYPVAYFDGTGGTHRLTPSGRHLFSANQKGDVIAIFARDAGSGRLTDTGRSVRTGTPMCVKVIA